MDTTMIDLSRQPATAIARGVATGRFTAEAVTAACLERIAAREPTVRAWAHLDHDLALRQARALDRLKPVGPLHGVPVGIKDVIDTADMPTQMGSAIYDGYRPVADASCVALLRAAGAVILGKTVTCEFAGVTAGATTNPHAADRTPGGSSSGSAAAVADFMVPVAIGTQTGGSVLRPASFCGIVGFKPSFGAINRAGLKFAAESLDTIGFMARSVDDVDLISAALSGRPPLGETPIGSLPRVGVCWTHLWPSAQAPTVAALEDAARRLAQCGAAVRHAELPVGFDALSEVREVLNDFERARAMAHEWNTARDRLSGRLQRTIERGLAMPRRRYNDAQRLAAGCRARLDELFDGLDILIAPCVPGEAPIGLEDTGDPKFQGLWTTLHVPTLSLPTHRGPNGLPVGIQLVGRPGADERLLLAARWAAERLGT
jgi:amidase